MLQLVALTPVRPELRLELRSGDSRLGWAPGDTGSETAAAVSHALDARVSRPPRACRVPAAGEVRIVVRRHWSLQWLSDAADRPVGLLAGLPWLADRLTDG